jgi:hypothetical protein
MNPNHRQQGVAHTEQMGRRVFLVGDVLTAAAGRLCWYVSSHEQTQLWLWTGAGLTLFDLSCD